MDILDSNADHLIKKLRNGGEKYPLLSEMYIPVIENFYSTVPNFGNVYDWLCLAHFEFLFCQEDERLLGLENELKKINDGIGRSSYNEIKELFHNESAGISSQTAISPINSIHNKIFGLRCELLAIKHFLDTGYSVQKIKESNVRGEKRPDLKATNSEKTTGIECKFIHNTRPITQFIYRYTRMLSFCWEPYINSSRFIIDKFYCSVNESSTNILPLSLENTNQIKEFIKHIILNQPKEHSTNLTCKIRKNDSEKSNKEDITLFYYKQDKIPPNLVPIPSQASFAFSQLDGLRQYLKRLRENRIIPQLAYADQHGWEKHAFLCIQLDTEFLAPFDKVENAIKNKFEIIKEDFSNDGIIAHIHNTSGYI
jgi:hypothetical protein